MSINIPCVLSIAGTDPSGGAGIQADIKSISATGSYAASVVTALVAQNTQGVKSIYAIDPEFVTAQLEAVFNDLNVAAVKIGMLHSQPVIEKICSAIEYYKPRNIVLDPVMLAKDSSPLFDIASLDFFENKLFPLVNLITPNLPEAECILAEKIISTTDMKKAAKKIGDLYQVNVLLKGGHFDGEQASDVLYLFKEKESHWLHAKRIATKNTHGTGCSYSSAIASFLAQGYSLIHAIDKAKKYLTEAILAGSKVSIGQGNGPVDHFYFLRQVD